MLRFLDLDALRVFKYNCSLDFGSDISSLRVVHLTPVRVDLPENRTEHLLIIF